MPATSLSVDRYVLGAAVVLTCALFTARAADPVNVIKLTALMLCALTLLGTSAYRLVRHRIAVVPTGPPAWAAVALVAGLLVSAAAAPVTTTAVLGAYGRNSGLLAYLSAVVLFVVALRVLRPPHTSVLVGGIVFAGLFTALYGLLQRMGVDAIRWNNPFNPIIAALGNPNFASGYLGIAASVAAGAALWPGWARGWRALSGVTAVLCLVAAGLSSSVQGPIAAATGLFVVGLTTALGLDDARRRRAARTGLMALALGGAGLLAVGAASQMGPAARIFTDRGSQARVYYWQAALEMFRDQPLLGVGLDQYGSFWRSNRSIESVAALGGPSYTDAAHSVPLQFLAQGGVVLSLAYAGFVVVVLVALVRGLLRLSDGDRRLLGAVGGGWTAYQVQSAVSIDQVPLIVLHFTLAGAVVATSGTLRQREVRLPGAARQARVHPNDARTRKRVAAYAPPVRRSLQSVDLMALGLVTLLTLSAAWFSLYPLRANVAAAEAEKGLAAGDGTLALTALRRASDLVPGQPRYWIRQGELFSQIEQPDSARQAFDEAAAQDPYDVNALSLAAMSAEQAGDLVAARRHYRRLLDVDPLAPSAILAFSRFELRHAGAAAARLVLEPAVLRLPRDAALWATLGDARLVMSDELMAREAYQRSLKLEPEQPVALDGLRKLAG